MEARDLRERIMMLGKEIAQCSLSCEGIINRPSEGIIPRGLVLEQNEHEQLSCVIVGLNPGKTKEPIRKQHDTDSLYETYLNFWNARIKNHVYYKSLRKLAIELGFQGAILWTDVCKCETNRSHPYFKRYRRLPIDTLRTCMTRFLRRELSLVDEEIPIIAVGNIAYQALCFGFLDRFIIGVPQPGNTYGQFGKLLGKAKSAKQRIEQARSTNKNCVRIFPKDLGKRF